MREKYADHNLTSLHIFPVAAPNITVGRNATNAIVTAETGGEEGTEGRDEEGEGEREGEEAALVVEKGGVSTFLSR